MHPNTTPAGKFTYSAVGSNTKVEVSNEPTVIFNISIEQNGGSAGFLQLYNNGTGDITAGVAPTLVYAVGAGTFTAGTPAYRDISYPGGLGFNQGLSYLWAAGPTGTVSHGVNAALTIVRNNL